MKYFLRGLFLLMVASGVQAQSDKAVVNSNLIFPFQSLHVHGSTIVALPDGDMLSAWFEGTGERTADDVKIMGARLKKGSKAWSSPFLMADTPDIPDCNPVMFLNKEGKLFLVWIAVQANLWEQSILRVRTTTRYKGTGAPEWEWQDNILLKPDNSFATDVEAALKTLPETHHGWAGYAPEYDKMIAEAAKDPVKRSIGWMTRIKPLFLDNGRIVLPLYSDGYNFSLAAISNDQGKTWKPSSPIVGRGPIQPALFLKKDGTIVAYMRDSGDAPNQVHYSESKDKGQTWTPSVKTDIPNTASVEALTLKDGRWVFVGNDMHGRTRLSLYVSDDEGKTWPKKITLENQPGGYSYPALIQSSDGLLHITYSYHQGKGEKSVKYVVVNPGLLK